MAAPNTVPTLSLHVTITIAPENVTKFLEALKPAYDAVIAEPECTFFEVYQSAEEPGVFKFVENWKATREWMINVQFKKDYYKPYLTITEPIYIKPREHEIYDCMPGKDWVYVSKEMAA
ncbi:uncharacterized protein BDR25DRAFT_303506 [Lindgomyces ingoldianus]|uniref:Uncharacterized protein n=1 Tax=Lindgomyces ingoldianus TaxID=673940 RepID=A0ACB6QV75_9PLEO|nr:uncharacterized protein BDR25DRAFT_303506 [Lindgomyces ingoldianus]KAF2470908.1 hypothetical protein BDR25DRAFT_303506 [Lindgomyces ingoldianus]